MRGPALGTPANPFHASAKSETEALLTEVGQVLLMLQNAGNDVSSLNIDLVSGEISVVLTSMPDIRIQWRDVVPAAAVA